jgi:tRNA modification GTPase
MSDTIAAIATPIGTGAIGIVRVSGADSLAILRRVFRREDRADDYASHMMYFGFVTHEGERVDEALAVFFRAPKSYTAEDSAEIYCHGGTVTVRRTLEAVLKAGARAAEPGEFTRRAFENGRIDLTRAEATLSLIEATSEAAARVSLNALSGGSARFISAAKESLSHMLAAIDAAIDFPDEVDETLTRAELLLGIDALLSSLEKASDETVRRRVTEGITVVLAGAPNVGKSSLLNAILNEERAIVHDKAGTTRDIIEGSLQIAGMSVTIYDTAGLRNTADAVEQIGIDRALARIERADIVFAVLDASRGVSDDEQERVQSVPRNKLRIIFNKTDLINGRENSILTDKFPPVPIYYTSAVSGAGIGEVIAAIRGVAEQTDGGGALVLNARQAELARSASAILREAKTNLEGGDPIDPLSTDLMAALSILCQIDGSDAKETVIDDIFRLFCVGK